MKIYLYQHDQQTGPYSESKIRGMVSAGTVQETDQCWHEGLAEWQPLNTVISFAPYSSSALPGTASGSVPVLIQTNVKQGAVIGGWVCFAIGLILLTISLWSFYLYGPLFLVALILSVSAMSQKRIVGGITLLLCTLILPPIVGGTLFLTRTGKAIEDMNSALKESAVKRPTTLELAKVPISEKPIGVSSSRDSGGARKTLAELRERKAAYEKRKSTLDAFRVVDARLFKDDSPFSTGNTIELTVKNDTEFPVSRVYFRAVYASPGRSMPWADDTFNYRITGGLEPGEKATWSLSPNMFRDLGRIAIKPDAMFAVTVTRLDGVDKKELFPEVHFSESDQKRLDELEEQFKE